MELSDYIDFGIEQRMKLKGDLKLQENIKLLISEIINCLGNGGKFFCR